MPTILSHSLLPALKLATWVSYLSCCDQIPDKCNCRKEGITLVYSLVRGGVSLQQEAKAVSYTESVVGEQMGMNVGSQVSVL